MRGYVAGLVLLTIALTAWGVLDLTVGGTRLGSWRGLVTVAGLAAWLMMAIVAGWTLLGNG